MIDGFNFSETYFYKLNPKGFLFLICDSTKDKPSEYIVNSQKKKLKLCDIDGIQYWCLPVSLGYIKTVRKFNERRVSGLYAILLQYLIEEGIKTFFYDIWLANKNYHQRKKNITEMCQFNYMKKRGLTKSQPDTTIVHITQDMSLKEASKMSL